MQAINHQYKLNYSNMKKADLFSLSSTLLAIFGLMQLDVSNLFLFMVLVAIYTIAMDFVYKACK